MSKDYQRPPIEQHEQASTVVEALARDAQDFLINVGCAAEQAEKLTLFKELRSLDSREKNTLVVLVATHAGNLGSLIVRKNEKGLNEFTFRPEYGTNVYNQDRTVLHQEITLTKDETTLSVLSSDGPGGIERVERVEDPEVTRFLADYVSGLRPITDAEYNQILASTSQKPEVRLGRHIVYLANLRSHVKRQ